MTIEEAAKFLFVSRAHIRALLASGQLLEFLPGNPLGDVEIETASVQAYRAKLDAAWQTWLDTDAEDNDPVGS
ncbi:MAG TPA: hypothetical protein VHC91_14510 [Trinickia sp.]|uniref:hypothetical protein n=1 Tax=Trinickia sp. TaxID=2571163 RepID=UPI002C4AFD38|nr:hypothetical protein [Trinickia sp.]HVW51586.1 hypothetical protein [Trinickia sp.]